MAEKPVTLTIAVSNYDHFYGGIVYPPAFGTMLAVNTTRGIRFAFCLFGYSYFCLCAAVLLFQPPDETEKYIPVRTDLPCHVVPVILSCASYAGCGSRIPWYTIELFCIYLVTWLIVVLAKPDMQAGLPACGHQ